jgi:SAM-dependent MidA family methyltransferase
MNTDDTPIYQSLQDEIASRDGAIPFSRFMEYALYDPQHGYYHQARQIIGRHGDFVTAPEISPMFSHCIANWCQGVLTETKGGDILEFGPGNGTMAADILQHLAEQDSLPDHYYLLELSPSLKARQQQRLKEAVPDCVDRCIWLDRLPDKPITGAVLANEILDAMPVEQFRVNGDALEQAYVSIRDNQLAIDWQPASKTVIAACGELPIPAIDDYQSEINLMAEPWLASVQASLAQGALLLIDYGFDAQTYYHPSRDRGTLIAHYQQQVVQDVLAHVGEQDITAHVDFTQVANAAADLGWHVAGYTSQAFFLLAMGLLEAAEADNPDDRERLKRAQAIKLLTMPHEMGELIKVMALTKGIDAVPGFMQDLRIKL